jgi:SpoIID/LytB domain protein
MSQTGAEEMARQGAGYKEILAWYYPNTVLTQAKA